MAWTTLKKKLECIARFHSWAEGLQIDIAHRVDSGSLFTEEEINQSLFSFLRHSNSKNKIPSSAVAAKTFNNILLYVREYLSWRFSSMLVRLPSLDPKFQSIQFKQKIILKWLYDLQLSTSVAESDLNKTLNSHQIEYLFEITNPDSSENPWHSMDIRQRNYLILQLFMNLGVRPSELLTIRVSDIDFSAVSSINIQRRPHDPEDPRIQSPNVKRKGRILPIMDMKFAKLLNNYLVEWRPKFDDKHPKGTDFLILSEDGNPLSYPALAKIFANIKHVSKCELPNGFTAGWFRHTFSSSLETNMRKAGIPEHRRREILMLLRGDSSKESQDVYLHAAIKEEAQNILENYQAKIFSTNKKLEEIRF